jgi:hypothetical protein
MSKVRQNHYSKFFEGGQYMSEAGIIVVPAIKPTCKGERDTHYHRIFAQIN